MQILELDFALMIPATHELLHRDFCKVAIIPSEADISTLFFAFSACDFTHNHFNETYRESVRDIPRVLKNGAAACVVRYDYFIANHDWLGPFADRLLVVEDSVVALQSLARIIHKRRNLPVIAVTGSAGKTTTKDLLAYLLTAAGMCVQKTLGNRNNGIGLPLTVIDLLTKSAARILVLEMGMSTRGGEISRLCSITPPDIGIVVNVLPVHMQHLGTIENIRDAKAELLVGMNPNGVAVLNKDDALVWGMKSLCRSHVSTGFDLTADVSATNIRSVGLHAMTYMLTTPSGAAELTLPQAGAHNVRNSLSAAAAAYLLGLDVKQVAHSLASAQSTLGRGNVLRLNGFTIADETYNSNPVSLRTVISSYLARKHAYRRLILVLGDMLELGTDALEIHRELGESLAKSDIHALIGVGPLASFLVRGATADSPILGFECDSSAQAEMLLLSLVESGDVVLIKGSRAVGLDELVRSLVHRFARPPARETLIN